MERAKKEFIISISVLTLFLFLIVAFGVQHFGRGGSGDSIFNNDAGSGMDAGTSRESALELEAGEVIKGVMGGNDNTDFYSFSVENGWLIEVKILPDEVDSGQMFAFLLPPGNDSPVVSTGEIPVAGGENFTYNSDQSGDYALGVFGNKRFEGSYLLKILLENKI